MEDRLPFFPRGFPTVEKIRDLAGASWYNDSKATNYDAAEVALAAPAQSDGGARRWAGQTGDPPGLVEGPRRQAGAVVLYGRSRETFGCPAGPPAVTAVNVHAWEGLSEAFLKRAACRQRDYRNRAVFPLTSLCSFRSNYGGLRSPREFTSAPCQRPTRTLNGHGFIG